MSVIDDLAKKLRAAQRAEKSARVRFNHAANETAACKAELERAEGRVRELESAISILRNNLKPAAEAPSNVTPLKR